VGAPFEYAGRLALLVKRQQEIEDELDLTKNQAPLQVALSQVEQFGGDEIP
jgi:hypothetical protein